MKNPSDTVGNRTRDPTTWKAAPKPTAPPRTQQNITYLILSIFRAVNKFRFWNTLCILKSYIVLNIICLFIYELY